MSPLQARAEMTRSRILWAAAQEFEQRGYAGTSTQSVAQRLNKTKGAIAYHFPTKKELALGLVVGQLDLWHRMRESARLRGIDPLETIVTITHQVSVALVGDVRGRAIYRLYHEPAENLQLPSPNTNWIAVVEELLQEAVNDASISAGIPTKDFAFICVSGLLGIEEMCFRLHQFEDLPRRVDQFWKTLLPILGRQEGSSELILASHSHESLIPPPPLPSSIEAQNMGRKGV